MNQNHIFDSARGVIAPWVNHHLRSNGFLFFVSAISNSILKHKKRKESQTKPVSVVEYEYKKKETETKSTAYTANATG